MRELNLGQQLMMAVAVTKFQAMVDCVVAKNYQEAAQSCLETIWPMDGFEETDEGMQLVDPKAYLLGVIRKAEEILTMEDS